VKQIPTMRVGSMNLSGNGFRCLSSAKTTKPCCNRRQASRSGGTIPELVEALSASYRPTNSFSTEEVIIEIGRSIFPSMRCYNAFHPPRAGSNGCNGDAEQPSSLRSVGETTKKAADQNCAAQASERTRVIPRGSFKKSKRHRPVTRIRGG